MTEDEMAQAKHKLGFLYRRCSISVICLDAWLEDEEFVQRVFDLIASGSDIGNAEILGIMKPMMAERMANKSLYKDFKFKSARRGMHQIERVLNV